MTGIYELAATGLQAQQRALEVIANNITNVNTPSFKRSTVRFSEMVNTRSNDGAQVTLNSSDQLSGVSTTAVLDLSNQGVVDPTSNPLDLAIEGPGFIELLGPNGQTMLWRGGRLAVSSDGILTGAGGMPLQSMISIPSDAAALSISGDGTVSAKLGAELPVELGKISLVQLDDSSSIERLDGGVYRVLNNALLMDGDAGDATSGRFVQGALERSNVDLNQEMVQLLIVQRAYAANAQLVQAVDQFMGISNGLRK